MKCRRLIEIVNPLYPKPGLCFMLRGLIIKNTNVNQFDPIHTMQFSGKGGFR